MNDIIPTGPLVARGLMQLHQLHWPRAGPAPMDSILLSVPLPPVSFLADLSLLWQMVTVLPPKPFNSGVPQGSVQSPTLILLFIDDLSQTNCPIASYTDESTLH